MTRSALEEYASAVRRRYKGADKAKKTRILDEFCQTTGMHRKAAVRLLNRQTRPRSVGPAAPNVTEVISSRCSWRSGRSVTVFAASS